MAVYSFALSTGDRLCDGQGWHFATDRIAHRFATSMARDIMSEAVKGGVLDIAERIDAFDENGALQFSVNFSEALEVRSSSGEHGQHE